MDNSLMENFFGLMKNEMFYGEEATFETLDDLKAAMEEYIRYYNEERISLKRKGLTPLQYRYQSLPTQFNFYSNFWGALHFSLCFNNYIFNLWSIIIIAPATITEKKRHNPHGHDA